MRILSLALIAALYAAPLRATDTPKPPVPICGIDIKAEDIVVKPKPAYVMVLLDCFPYRDKISKAGKAFSNKLAAEALLKLAGDTEKLVKIELVEFPERDDYGAPRWEKIKFLARYEVTHKGKVVAWKNIPISK